MHCLFYNNLPHALSGYCIKIQAQRVTRNESNKNFVLPSVKTARGQTSIRFTGPKAWSQVPLNLKDVAYKIPFAKKMKSFILETQRNAAKDLPVSSYIKEKRRKAAANYNELKDIFDSSHDDSEFYGFELELNEIFEEDIWERGDFNGFQTSQEPI